MSDILIVPPKYDMRLVIGQVLNIGDNINDEFMRQAVLYARVGFYSAQAKHKVRRLKNELEVVSASIRKNIAQRRGVRLTKDEMHYKVIRKKRYCQKQRELEKAIYDEELISVMLRALEHKKDALVGLGANYRQELNGELKMLRRKLNRNGGE